MTIKAGATAWHRIKPGVDLALIRDIIITYKSKSPYGSKVILQRRYPAQTELYEGDILVPLTQADTAKLREESGESVLVELQYNYTSGAVDKSQIKTVAIRDTLATEYVDGSAPDAAQKDAEFIEFESDAVIVMAGTGGGYKIGSGLQYDAATNTLSAELSAEMFHEIPNKKVQEIFNKVMEG